MFMKKTFVFIIVFLFVLFSSFVYAEDENEMNIETEIIQITEDIEIEEIYERDLKRLVTTPVGPRINATQLENTIGLKTKELSEIIRKIYDQEIVSEEELEKLKEKLSDLIVLKNYVSSRIVNNQNIEQEDVINNVLSARKRFDFVIKEVKEILKETLTTEDLEIIKQEIISERQERKQEIAAQNRERIRTLVQEHNNYIRNVVVSPLIEQAKGTIDVRQIRERTANKSEIATRNTQQIRETVVNMVKDYDIINKQNISAQKISETINQINEENKIARQEVLNKIREQGRDIAITADVINISSKNQLNYCETDDDCVPHPSCHPLRCINIDHYDRFFNPDLVCTMEVRPNAAYSSEDCLCVNNVCTNKNFDMSVSSVRPINEVIE